MEFNPLAPQASVYHQFHHPGIGTESACADAAPKLTH